MKRLPILLLVLFIINSLNAQTDWEWLNPKPSGYPGRDINFISSDTGFIVNNNQLLITIDSGENWSEQIYFYDGTDIDFYNEVGVLIGNHGNVKKSTDYGFSWEDLSLSTTNNLNTVSIINEDTIIISSETDIYKSFDGGVTWHSREVSIDYMNKTLFLNSNVGHAVCKFGKIIKTVDGGENWYITESNSSSSDFLSIFFVNDLIGFASCEYSDMFKTIDGGETWTEVNFNSTVAHSIYFVNETLGYTCGESGRMFKTTDGGISWISVSQVIAVRNSLSSIFFISEDTGFAVGNMGRIIKTTDGGVSWQEHSPPYGDINQIEFTEDSIGYLLCDKIYKTIDKGNNWDTLSTYNYNDTYGRFSHGNFISADTFYVLGHGQFRSEVLQTFNGGNSFMNHIIYIYSQEATSLFFLDYRLGFVCLTDGPPQHNGIYRTSNACATWTQISEETFSQMHFINSEIGFGIRSNSIYKTIDGGHNWNKIFSDNLGMVKMFFVNDEIIYIAGKEGHISKTVNGGEVWSKLDAGNKDLYSICFLNENIGFVSGEYNYFFKTTNGGLTWDSEPIYRSAYSLFIDDNNTLYATGKEGSIFKTEILIDDVNLSLVPAHNILATTANVAGIVSSNNGLVYDIEFEFGTDNSFDHSVAANPSTIDPGIVDTVYSELTDLLSETEYQFRIKALNNGITYYSDTLTFTTISEIYISISYPVIYDNSSATLEATLTSLADTITEIEFQYGDDYNFSNSWAGSPSIVPGGEMRDVFAEINELSSDTYYVARVKVTYKGEKVYSPQMFFKTMTDYEFVINDIEIQDDIAIIESNVVATKDTIENIVIEYGKTLEYEFDVQTNPNIIAKGQSEEIQTPLYSLDTSSSYYCRMKATLGDINIYSDEHIIHFGNKISILPLDVEQINSNTVIVEALINPTNRFLDMLSIEYGISEEDLSSFSYTVPKLANSNQTTLIATEITNLQPNTQYYFRVKGYHLSDIYYSEIFTYLLKPDDIEEEDLKNSISIFPNPARDIIFIETPYKFQKIEVFDLNTTKLISYHSTEVVNVSSLNSGVYIIKIYFGNKIVAKKFIKQ